MAIYYSSPTNKYTDAAHSGSFLFPQLYLSPFFTHFPVLPHTYTHTLSFIFNTLCYWYILLILYFILSAYHHLCISFVWFCCNKLAQIWWLKQTEIYCIIILETRSLSASLGCNQGVHRVALPPESRKETFFFSSSTFWWLLAFTCLWLHPTNLCHHVHIAFSSSARGESSPASLI